MTPAARDFIHAGRRPEIWKKQGGERKRQRMRPAQQQREKLLAQLGNLFKFLKRDDFYGETKKSDLQHRKGCQDFSSKRGKGHERP